MKIDVFFKALYCDEFHEKNISNWMSIFDEEKYRKVIVCPKSQAECFASKFQEDIVQDGQGVSFEKHKLVLEKMGKEHWNRTAISNFTCSSNAKSKYFWNIDADSWIEHESENILSKLCQIEKVSMLDELDIISLDYYRTSNRKNWIDHWSFGVAFQKTDFDIDGQAKILDQKDFECEWLCNMDRVVDQIRKKTIAKKIKTFAVVGMTLHHGHVSHYFGENSKSVSKNYEVEVVPYPDADDYIVL
jgi:hypothetical protein